jgi:SOS-response transcriptional repressor LexA
MKPLTVRQENILIFIINFHKDHGYPPTLREIGDEFGINSTNGVNDHLMCIERKGWIIKKEFLSRGIMLTRKAINTYIEDESNDVFVNINMLINDFPYSVDMHEANNPEDGAKAVINRLKSILISAGEYRAI